jgi:hypothetical protein
MKQDTNIRLSTVLVSSPPKSSSASSPSSRTPRSTRSPPGSSTGSATLSTARTRRSSPTASTPSCVTTSSASRRSAPTAVSDTTGASASAASTPRPPAAAAGPSVSPRRRVVKRDATEYGNTGWTWRDGWVLHLSEHDLERNLLLGSNEILGKCTLVSESLKTKSNAFKVTRLCLE